MLQDIRKNVQGPVAKVIVGLIVIAFAGFGVESILLGGSGNSVAEVNGEVIGPGELQLAVNNQQRQLMAMMGENFDPTLLDDDRLQTAALEQLIARKLQMQAAQDMNLSISEAEIGKTISSLEQFQIDGQFSPDIYKSALAGAGFTPASFKAGLREDMIVSQMRMGLAGTEFATSLEKQVNATVAAEQRDVRYLTIPLASFSQEAEVTDSDVQAYYETHSERFVNEESVLLDYFVLSADQFREPVDEADLQAEYEAELENYQYQTENRVSHILFEAGDEQAKQVALAQNRLLDGEDFAAVASDLSDDIGSASSGGDLGFSSGDAFPPEMEEAIAALEPGVVSEPVATDAGIHLILVTERRDGEAPSLDDMRLELTDRLQLLAAGDELVAAVEQLRDAAFNADDLVGPARDLDREVQRSGVVTRAQGEGLFANASLREAAFSEDVLQQGLNSDVIELGSGEFVVLRVAQHNDAAPKPLVEVRDEVVAVIIDKRARNAANDAAEAALAALRGGQSVEEYATAAGYTWQVELGAQRRSMMLPPEILQRVFELPAPQDNASVFDSVATFSGDVAVIELARVAPGELNAELSQALNQQVRGEFGNLVLQEYQRRLRDSAEISVL